MWLDVTTSNHDPRTIFSFYVEAVAKCGGAVIVHAHVHILLYMAECTVHTCTCTMQVVVFQHQVAQQCSVQTMGPRVVL